MNPSFCAGVLVLSCMALLGPKPALSGPWAREAGSVFLSFSTEITMDRSDLAILPEYDGTLYGEVGLGHRLTLGADLYQGPSSHTYLLTLQRTLTAPGARHQFAIRLGGGVRREGTTSEPVYMAGATWGTGFGTRFGDGWATLDVQVRRSDVLGQEIKLDATLGLKPADRWMAILQVQSSRRPGQDSLRLQASVVRTLSKRLKLEAGVVYGLRNSTRAGLKLALWTEF